jgi:hypothetical protein
MATDGIRLLDDGFEDTGVIALDPGGRLSVGYRIAWPHGPL